MGFEKQVPPPFAHQIETAEFAADKNAIYDASDPGTGKTRSWIDIVVARQKRGAKAALVLAPKSILRPSWEADIHTFAPGKKVSVAYAENREAAFRADADFYITNHDATNWLKDNPWALDNIDMLIIDEVTAYKHRTSQRSKSLGKITNRFTLRAGLSGTPNSNGVLDLWHQYLLLDGGAHLGNNYYKFRQTVCEPQQVGPGQRMIRWVDKPGVLEALADIVSDMTIRHKFEDCIDIPEHAVQTMCFDLTAKHLALYREMEKRAILELQDGMISAIHAGALATKLLQIASGAVYDVDHVARKIASERYELVATVAEERDQCMIAFNWTHQRDELLALAKKMNVPTVVIDGGVSIADRNDAVAQFQAGKAKWCLAHPMSASHGLTMTAGTTTIWPSPVYDAERYQQFNRRIYRAGQKQKTETIRIAANDTVDLGVYEKLDGKVDLMVDLLHLLQAA